MAPLLTYDLIALGHEALAAALDLNADGAVAIEEDAAGVDVGAECEVEPVAGQVEVGQGSADADTVEGVAGARGDAGGFGMVLVSIVVESEGRRRRP